MLGVVPVGLGREGLNHPNRSRAPSGGRNPSPAAIRAARESCGLTQAQAGAVVHATLRAWQRWESGDAPMHPAFWELFGKKTLEWPRFGSLYSKKID